MGEAVLEGEEGAGVDRPSEEADHRYATGRRFKRFMDWVSIAKNRVAALVAYFVAFPIMSVLHCCLRDVGPMHSKDTRSWQDGGTDWTLPMDDEDELKTPCVYESGQ